MRLACLLLLGSGVALAQDEAPETRYDVALNVESYPQGTPKEALGSVIKAIDRERFEYIVAQLFDPELVDRRIQQTKSTFPMVVADVRTRVLDEPESLKELRRFHLSGKYTEEGDIATVTLDEIKGRTVSLKKVGQRWYMLNQRSAPKAPPPEKKAP